MKKFFLLVPVVLLTALALIVFGPMHSDGVASANGAELHLFEHLTAVKQITVSTTADLRGNYIVFADPVFDAADKNQVGTANGTCLTTSATLEECHFTLILPKGQITVEGPVTTGVAISTFAITGGTGIYDEAKGQVVQKEIKTAAGNTEFDLSVDVD